MAGAPKIKDPDCYTSDRVFDGVRKKDPKAAASHVARLKKALAQGKKVARPK